MTSHSSPFFRGDKGWEPTSYERKQRTILGLHPDALDFRSGLDFNGPPLDATRSPLSKVRAEGRFALDHGLPASKSHSPLMFQDLKGGRLQHFWYRHLDDSRKVRYPDGSVVETTEGFAARDLDGNPRRIASNEEGALIPSVFAPGFRRWKVRTAQQYVGMGLARVEFDAIFWIFGTVDLSVWAQSAFRTHLASLPQRRRERLGIDRPEEFGLREYFQSNSLPGNVHDLVSDHLDDPVVREYVIFIHRGLKSFVREYVERTKAAFPDRAASNGVNMVGNQFKVWRPQSIFLSDHFDAVVPEYSPSIPPRIADHVHKLALAAGRYDKPTQPLPSGLMPEEPENVPEGFAGRDNATLIRLQIAEGYANGTTPKLQLTGLSSEHIDERVNNVVRADGTVKPPVQELVDFVWTHRRLLDGGTPDNRVAVAYSLPTLVWQHGERFRPHRESFERAAAALREHQIPYDAVLFGHPRLWDDADQLDRLSTYDVVVLPGIESVTDAQVDAVEALLAEGSSVVVVGDPPARSAMYEEREDVRTLVDEHPEATVLDGDPSEESVAGAVEDGGPRQVDVDEGADLAVNVITNEERRFTALHLVNYAYDPETDEVETKSDVGVSVAGIDFDVTEAVWYSPDREQSLEFDVRDGSVSTTIPEIAEWGFVVFAPSRDAIAPAVDEGTAAVRLSSARDAVAAAEDAGRTHRLEPAKVDLQRAETAARAGAHQQVVSAAEAATERAAAAFRPPVVGLDQAHDSSEDHSWEYYEGFRTEFDDYTHRRVEEWSEETMADLDVLVVPPPRPGATESSGFTDADVTRLTEFVDGGGSLFVAARSGVAPVLNVLLEPFGLRVDGEPLAPGKVHVVSRPTKLTRMTLKWRVTGETATAVEADDGQVLARAFESDAALVNRSHEFYEGPSEDGPTGTSVYVATTWGAGFVAVVGYDQAFFQLGEAGDRPDDYEVVRSALSFLGRRAREARGP